MSLALAALGRLGRVIMPGPSSTLSDYEPHRRTGLLDATQSSADDRGCKITKFHIVLMVAGVLSIIAVIVGYVVYGWYGVIYVSVGVTVLLFLPLAVFRIVMMSREYKNRSLRQKKKHFHKSAEQLHKAHPHLYANEDEHNGGNSVFLEVPDNVQTVNETGNSGTGESHEITASPNVTFVLNGSPPKALKIREA